MECSTLSVVVLLLFMSVCNCQRQIFYIRPSDSSHCPQEVNASQCYDLTTLVSEGHLSMASNASLLFLPGEHFLEQDLNVKSTEAFQMTYYDGKEGSSVSSVKVTCIGYNKHGSHSVRVQNVSAVKIDSITFQSCGVDVDSSGVLQLRSVDYSEITNCKLYESRSSAVFIEDSNSVISDCLFVNGSCSSCSGGGIHAVDSNVKITGSTVIENNSVWTGNGGGLSSTNSNVHVDGNIEFSRNIATNGGGMTIHNHSYFTFSKRVIFSANLANELGGGLLVGYNSHCTFNGSVKFFNNSAFHGGGMTVYISQCTFNRCVAFFNNAAVYGGGLLVASNSYCTFNGSAEFSGNSATHGIGGGVGVYDNSNCTFNEQAEFSGNSATHGTGGGVGVYDNSNCTFNEQAEFSGNSATHGGGVGVYDNSNCTFNEQAEFSGNSATHGGGVGVYDNSNCTFNEQAEFSGNSATRGGGIIVSDYSNCTFSKQVRVSGNIATIGGGMNMYNYSFCTFNGSVCFSNNSATIGGGVITQYHSYCTYNGEIKFSGNIGGGMDVFAYSFCTFNGSVEFSGNFGAVRGGGIEVLTNSCCTFNGEVKFSGNIATFGGGMTVHNYSFSAFNGNVVFSDNRAIHGGGIALYVSSYGTFNGSTKFSDNSADYGGGMVVELNSDCSFKGSTRFSGNSGSEGGGMRVLRNSNCTLNGNVIFLGNSAIEGGGIQIVIDSNCIFTGNAEFSDNTAIYGAGMEVLINSSCTFNEQMGLSGNCSADDGELSVTMNPNCPFNESVIFSGNDAAYGGGIEVVTNSNCTFNALVEFSNNSAAYGGGMEIRDNANCTFNRYTEFSHNSAAYGGGMEIRDNANCTFNRYTEFSHNSAAYGGGMELYGNSDCTFNKEVIFGGNSAGNDGGGMKVGDYSRYISNGYAGFSHNRATGDGGGMEVLSSSNCIFNGNVIISGNSATFGGGVTTKDHSHCTFAGNSEFSDNIAADFGGGVDAYDNSYYTFSTHVQFLGNTATKYGGGINAMTNSNCTFNGFSRNSATNDSGRMEGRGDLHCENNTALYGGGLALSGGSSLYFNNFSRLTIQFISNQAQQYGGAIWVEDTRGNSCTNDKRNMCFIQFEHHNDTSWLPIVTAINNTAMAGSNIYGGDIDSCLHGFESNVLMPFLNDTRLYQVCLCAYSKPECSISYEHIEVFSGEQLELTLAEVGQKHGTIPTVILDPIHAESSNGTVTQTTKGNCSVLTITSSNTSVKLMLHPKISMCTNTALFILTVNVIIKPCPPGFMLHSESKSCTCDDNLKELDNNIECNINSQSFSHQHGVWIGYVQQSDTIIYHPHCPFDYCTQELSTFTLNSTDHQCRYNRSGLICGACREGYSLTLGGSKCRECSHMYLVLFIPLALAGVVLVFFLLTFKLTASTGTINGLIFFANIIGTNSSIFLPTESTVILRVFVAWLNLDLGIDTCLFNGLDMYVKVWLQFAFPFYVFTLIAIILFLSHRSTLMTKLLGRNPVAVLATLILLAYTKLFRAVLTVMSFTYINGFAGSSIAVWLCDGNVRYMSGKHIPLVLLAVLITLLLIIPYTVILLFAPYLQRHSQNKLLFWINDYRLKAFLHSYYAPLKDKYRSWIGLLLVLRLCLLIVFVSNSFGDPSINLFAITTAVTILLCWRVLSGIFYSNWLLDALELFFIMKLGLFSVATLYVLNTSGNQRVLADTLVGVAFIVFVAITVYHSWRQLTDSRWWRLTLKSKLQKLFKPRNAKSLKLEEDDEKNDEPQTPQEVLTTTIELREPVLEFCDH